MSLNFKLYTIAILWVFWTSSAQVSNFEIFVQRPAFMSPKDKSNVWQFQYVYMYMYLMWSSVTLSLLDEPVQRHVVHLSHYILWTQRGLAMQGAIQTQWTKLACTLHLWYYTKMPCFVILQISICRYVAWYRKGEYRYVLLHFNQDKDKKIFIKDMKI